MVRAEECLLKGIVTGEPQSEVVLASTDDSVQVLSPLEIGLAIKGPLLQVSTDVLRLLGVSVDGPLAVVTIVGDCSQ